MESLNWLRLSTLLPSGNHLRCTNHFRQNVKDKLRSLGASQSVSAEFLADIFGVQSGTNFESGLIDADSEISFTAALEHLKHQLGEKLHVILLWSSVLVAEFLANMFGVQRGTNFESGLIDADSETSFTAALEHLKHHWNNLQRSCMSSCSDPQF